jgi:hypothetical protein
VLIRLAVPHHVDECAPCHQAMQVLQGLEMTRPQIQTVPVAAFVIVAVEWACSAVPSVCNCLGTIASNLTRNVPRSEYAFSAGDRSIK